MHTFPARRCSDLVTDHALITWLSCTAHVADHAMITQLPRAVRTFVDAAAGYDIVVCREGGYHTVRRVICQLDGLGQPRIVAVADRAVADGVITVGDIMVQTVRLDQPLDA